MPNPYWAGAKVDYSLAYLGGAPAGTNGGVTGPAISTWEANARKQSAIVGINARWLDNGIAHPFSAYLSLLNDCYNHNRIAYMDWGVWDLAQQSNSQMVNYANIINGAFATLPDGFTTIDSFITSWATAAAAWKHPFFIRIFHEMNLNSNQWAWSLGNVTVGGHSWTNTVSQHMQAWTHIYDLFQAAGAKNVTFVWCPNVRSSSGTGTFVYPYNTFFPGENKVHWMGLDGYTPDASRDLDDMFLGPTSGYSAVVDSMAELRALCGLPIGIWETGVDGYLTGVLNRPTRATNYATAFETGIPAIDPDLIAWFMTYYSDEKWTPDLDGSGTTNADMVTFAKGVGGTNQVGVNFTYPPDLAPIAPYRGTPQRERFTNAVLNTHPSDLQGYWKHNEASGTTLVDYSGHTRNGTYTGAGIILSSPKVIPGTLDLSATYDGTANYATVPDDASFSLVTTGALTIMVCFTLVSFPAVNGSIMSKAVSSGSNNEYALGVLASGALDFVHWNPGGATYAATVTSGGVVAIGVPMLVIVTLDQSRSPVGRRGYAVLGATSMTFNNTVDTLANAPANTTSPINFGRRGSNDRFLNVRDSHCATWSVALTDLSMNTLLHEFNNTRRLPRVVSGGVG